MNTETEITVIPDSAETVYINHPESSYGIFCYNSKGDLFLNSDWGMYGYAWRAYGQNTFKEFLSQCNAEYLVGKFGINYREISGKAMKPHQITNVSVLLREFIKHLKNSL